MRAPFLIAVFFLYITMFFGISGCSSQDFPDDSGYQSLAISLLVENSKQDVTIGGTVTGYYGSGLTLVLNSDENLTIPSGASSFTFTSSVKEGDVYSVKVGENPTSPAQTCTASQNAGIASGTSITNISLACSSTTYTISGTISGLTGTGLVLQNNSGDDLAIDSGTTSFSFKTSVADGAGYSVTVKTSPTSPDQTCTVSSGSGTVSTANVTNVSVSCSVKSYTIGGTISGLSGSGLVLQLNSSETLSVSSGSTSFSFTSGVSDGSTYSVAVQTSPSSPNQTCTVTSGSGTVSGAAISSVQVTCSTTTYTVGGTITGLSGNSLVLQNNLGDDLTVASGSTSFTFPTAVADNSAYSVTVMTAPTSPTQSCVVSSGSGTIASSNITGVSIACTTSTYTIGGTLSGLSSGSVGITLNGYQNLTINANGSFVFPSAMSDATSYNVTVFAQPSGGYCTVTNGSGTLAGAAITSVSVSCAIIATGTYDTSFGTSGVLSYGITAGDMTLVRMAYGGDGKLHISGYGTGIAGGADADAFACRLSTAGVLDATFNGGACSTTASVPTQTATLLAPQSMVVDSTYRMILSGSAGNADVDAILIGLLDGSPDTAGFAASNGYLFVDDPGTDSYTDADYFSAVTTTYVSAVEKFLVVGTAATSASVNKLIIFRYNTDGTLDTSFNGTGYLVTGLTVDKNTIRNIVMDGSNFYITGEISSVPFIAKFDSAGAAVSGFGSSGIMNFTSGEFWNAKKGADGKFYFVGQKTGGDATKDAWVVRLNTDGTMDNSFDTDGEMTLSTGTNEIFNAIDFDKKGNLICVGYNLNGAVESLLFSRITSDGILDTTFVTSDASIETSASGYFLDKQILNGSSTSERATSVYVHTDGLIYVGAIAANPTNHQAVLLRFK